MAVVKTLKLPDRHKFQAGELEGAAGYQLLELLYSNLVEASGRLAESGCPIGLKSGTPTDESFLAED